jgi:hypothetical protein
MHRLLHKRFLTAEYVIIHNTQYDIDLFLCQFTTQQLEIHCVNNLCLRLAHSEADGPCDVDLYIVSSTQNTEHFCLLKII